MATCLVIAALGFDLGVVAAARDWPLEVSTPAVLGVLWLAWLVSLCAFFALRARGRGDDWRRGGREPQPEPQPPRRRSRSPLRPSPVPRGSRRPTRPLALR